MIRKVSDEDDTFQKNKQVNLNLYYYVSIYCLLLLYL